MTSWTVRAVLALLSWLPMGVAQRMGSAVGGLAGRLHTSSRRRILENLARCFPDMGAAERHQLMRDNLVHTGRMIFEWGAFMRWNQPKIEALVSAVTGEELLRDALGNGRGVVLAPIHLGAWELMGLYLSARYPITTIYLPLRLGNLDEYCRVRRSRFGGKLVPAGFSALRQMHAALRNGELVAVMPDQDPGRGQGVFAPLFGLPANTSTLVSNLARRADADVVFACVERLAPGRGFVLHFHPSSPEVCSDDPLTAARALNEHIEQLVATAPEQYIWRYGRHRRKPPREPPAEATL